jgi:hypothetical protein
MRGDVTYLLIVLLHIMSKNEGEHNLSVDNHAYCTYCGCQVLSAKLPDLLDFHKDLAHLEEASKVCQIT